MTVGQLIECIMGKACCGKGSIGDATAFTHINNESVSDLLNLVIMKDMVMKHYIMVELVNN